MAFWSDMLNPQLITPFSILISASTNAGKTLLARDLIVNHYLMFDKPIVECVWLHHRNARNDELFKDLTMNLTIPITFKEGFDAQAQDIADGTLFQCEKDQLKCLVIDDLVSTALKSQAFIDLFTIQSHHQSIVVVGILQCLYGDTPSQRQVMNSVIKNASYIVLFPERRQTQVCKQIARYFFPGEEYKLMLPFLRLIEEKKKHSYMLVDFIGSDMPVRFNCLRPTDTKEFFTFGE